MQPQYRIGDNRHSVEPVRRRAASINSITLAIDGHLVDARIEWRDRNHGELTLHGERHEFFCAQDANRLFIHIDGRTLCIDIANEFAGMDSERGGDGTVRAPMPGMALEWHVTEGDTVSAGQTLLLIESMKMQTEIKAPIAGTVSATGVSAGQAFDKGTLLVDITAEEGTA